MPFRPVLTTLAARSDVNSPLAALYSSQLAGGGKACPKKASKIVGCFAADEENGAVPCGRRVYGVDLISTRRIDTAGPGGTGLNDYYSPEVDSAVVPQPGDGASGLYQRGPFSVLSNIRR